MSVIKGLKNINALLDKPKSDAPKVRWLKLADGQSVKIRFIEELDEDSLQVIMQIVVLLLL